ncbi:hypothetical protein SEA_ALAINAMARIE_82 [Gordonia phage AlainaMarie]|nr:hypothetical protein SEA_ALAINAMARIE_82 [Gordonia phage AlainaMarie]
MTYTTHGHHIQGTPLTSVSKDSTKEIPCDGPGDCTLCSEEAADALNQVVQELRIRGRHKRKHRIDVQIEHGEDSELWPGGLSRHLTTLSCECGTQIVEQTIVDRAYADKEFMKELNELQAYAVGRLHSIHISAATRRRR